jgi:hypothetical protein
MTILTGYAIVLLTALTPWLADEQPVAVRAVARSAQQVLVGRVLGLLIFAALLSVLLVTRLGLSASLQDAVTSR